jgi:hypothetical protein
MKKEILFGAIALLISAGVMAQTSEPIQTQTKTKKQLRIEAKQQIKVQDQTQSGDPIMTQAQTQTRTKAQVQDQTQSGDPIMTQTQTRTQLKDGSGEGQGQMVREQAKLNGEAQKSMKQAKTATKNKGAAKSVRTNRPATVKGTGAGRK